MSETNAFYYSKNTIYNIIFQYKIALDSPKYSNLSTIFLDCLLKNQLLRIENEGLNTGKPL
ncbi:MAG TPA: hypothetical protein DD405_04455 [Desulfobacteraceae bacterium]|nr:hypothetical protein [Desulfobacteraceae bacterium]